MYSENERHDHPAENGSKLTKPTQAFIGLGSNLGDGRANLLAAWQRLGREEGVSLIGLSSPCLTEPVGMVSEQWFTNAVGEIATSLAPEGLLAALLAIENEFGRDRGQGPDRPLDLDLLYYGELIMNSPALTLPHPRIGERRFVLVPLAELAPGHVHPLLGRTTGELLRGLRSPEKIQRQQWPGREADDV